jgi:leucyl/phenylalanyl-tRNA--protein transferase
MNNKTLMIPKLEYSTPTMFPDPVSAPDHAPLAYGGDLSPSRLLHAYRQGIFPWFNEGDPIYWWSPNPRLVMRLEDFKLSKSLKRKIANGNYEVRVNTNFHDILKGCQEAERKGQDHTWITDEMIGAYEDLFYQGNAYSYETYLESRLVGGLYGVVMGRVFFGESMFALESDASKIAYAYMVDDLRDRGFELIDCKIPSDHMKSLGATEMERSEFLELLKALTL